MVMNLKHLLIFILVSFTFRVVYAQSVLASGEWHKVGLTESKVYKLDYDFLEKTLGINTSKIDPRTLKVYGNGGGMLPQENNISRPNDLIENAILAVGESDAKFDKSDYFLFYGQGSSHFQLQPNGELQYESHDYCDTAYYFITYGEGNGLRMTTLPNLVTSSNNLITTYRDYIVYEENEEKIFESGREWYSKPLKSRGDDVLFRNFEYNIPGIRDSIGLDLKLLAATANPASFDISLNGALLGNVPVEPIISYQYSDRAKEYDAFYSVKNNSSENLQLKIDFRENIAGDTESKGYFDYFVLGFDRNLKLYGDQTIFRSLKNLNATRTFRVGIDGSFTPQLLNISDPQTPSLQLYSRVENTLSFTENNTGHVTEYIIFDPSKSLTPKSFGKVPNQNIKAFTTTDAIIISAPEFLSQARRLADFHQSHDGLSVAVVTPRQIYNEFSSGAQDVTALRDYLRYIWITGNNRLKYALLFGDCSHDYKYNVTYYRDSRKYANENFVPVYESRESIHKLYSHSSDDYYAFFEDDEGDWYEGNQDPSGRPISGTFNDHTQEIGIGRIPSKNITEATNAVDKIIRYATSSNTLGDWRNEITYVVDDGDNNTHMRDADLLSVIIAEEYPEYNVTKLFLDNFQQPENKSPALSESDPRKTD